MEPWTFAFATDIHVGSPRSFRFQPAWNENWQTARRQIIDINPDLLLLGGDLARDGNLHTYELEAAKADLDALPFPYRVVPGNMDTGNKHTDVESANETRDDLSLNITSEQVRRFESVFGQTQWSFVHRDVRFTGFCDMLAGSGLPEEGEFWAWLEAQRDQPKARYHVWVMHSTLFMDDPGEPNFDITDADQYHDWYFNIDEPHRGRIMSIFEATGANLVLCGHVHCRRTRRVKGMRFDIGPSTAFKQYEGRWEDGDATLGFLRYDVSDDGIECRFVPLDSVSGLEGYGPGGHPRPELRDYSSAREK